MSIRVFFFVTGLRFVFSDLFWQSAMHPPRNECILIGFATPAFFFKKKIDARARSVSQPLTIEQVQQAGHLSIY